MAIEHDSQKGGRSSNEGGFQHLLSAIYDLAIYDLVFAPTVPNRDEADILAPARGIAVSVLVAITMWLAIVTLVLLIMEGFWDPT